MIRAYSEIYLNSVMHNLAALFDIAIKNSTHFGGCCFRYLDILNGLWYHFDTGLYVRIPQMRNMQDRITRRNVMAKNDRFEKIYSQGTLTVMEIWVDKETGVHYLRSQGGYSSGLTPLLDGEGKVVVSPVVEQ